MSFYSHLPLEELTDVVARFPEEVELRLALVEYHVRNQDYAQALQQVIAAEQLGARQRSGLYQPDDPEMEAWVAMCLIFNQDVPAGHSRLQRVVRNNPCCEFQQRLVEEIIPLFTGQYGNPGWLARMTDDDLEIPESFLLQNRSFSAAIDKVQEDSVRGCKLLIHHLEQYPDDINARLYLAITYCESDNITEAIETYRHVLQLDDQCATAYFDMAALVDDCDQAIELTRTGLRYCPFAMHARYNLGMFLLQRGDPAGARRELTRIPADSPHYIEALLATGMTYEEEGDLACAIELIEKAVCLSDRGDVLGKYGQLLADCGLHDEAMVEMRRAIEIDPEQPSVLANIGLLHLQEGQFELAQQSFKSALQLEPCSEDAAINLAVLISEAGDHLQAIAILEKALEHHPQHPLICQNLGAIFCHVRQLDKALDYTQRSLQLGAASAELFWNLANIHCLRRERELCLENLAKAIERDDRMANQFQQDIDFDCYWTDPDFLALIHNDRTDN